MALRVRAAKTNTQKSSGRASLGAVVGVAVRRMSHWPSRHFVKPVGGPAELTRAIANPWEAARQVNSIVTSKIVTIEYLQVLSPYK